MSEPIDVGSIVLTQEAPKAANQPKQNTVDLPIDVSSIAFKPPEKILEDTQARVAFNPPKPMFQRILEFGANPVSSATQAAIELGAIKGQKDWSSIEFLPLKDDKNKSRDSGIISNITGIPQTDIEQHYDALKALYHFSTQGLAGASSVASDFTQRIPGRTTEGFLNAVMTPAIVAGIVAEPPLAIARLIGFTALHEVVNHAFNIDEKLKTMPKDKAASIRVLQMITEGLAIGGVEHGIDKTINMDKIFDFKDLKMDMNFSDVMEKYSYHVLQENGLPDVITLAPTTLEKIYQKQKLRDVASRERREAIARAVSDEPLPGDADILSTLGVDKKTVETAIENGLGVKVKAEKLVKVAHIDKDAFLIITNDVTKEAQDRATPTKTTNTSLETPQNGIENPIAGGLKPTDLGGEGTVSGIAKSIEADAIKQKLTDKGFDQMAEYTEGVKKEQAQMISDLMKADIERAKRIATGKEWAPEGLRTEALFSIMKDYAMDTRDGKLALELAQSPVASEISAAGSKLSMSDMADPNSATAKIREIQKAKEEASQKKMKGKTADKEKAVIKKELSEKIAKSKPSKYNLMSLLDEIKC